MLGIKLTNKTTHLLISIGSSDLQTTTHSISKSTKKTPTPVVWDQKGNHNIIKYERI